MRLAEAVVLLVVGIGVETRGAFASVDFQPQQIHLAIGDTNSDMVVTWVTSEQTPSSTVKFGTNDLSQTAEGNAILFTDGGSEHRTMWIHRVTLRSLTPDTRYFYNCGSAYGWSDDFTFKTWKSGTDWPVSVAIFGDMGADNARSLPRLIKETQNEMYDAVIHVGDFAYDMDSDNARVGDEFMREIEPIAAYVPYMTCPGNHEYPYNFSNYRARFSMPHYEDTESYFFSWDMGPVHFIAINTEAYYYLGYGETPLTRQYQWMIDDLEAATKPEARAERPWIILFGHRPMYCSNLDFDDCSKRDCITRVGLPSSHLYPMEVLLDKYGVDLAIWAHEHSYERLWPMYNFTVLNGSTAEPYTNPRGPVHFISGSAGCSENHNYFIPFHPYWSAFRSVHYGYTRLTAHNKTHLYWEQVSENKGGEVIDSAWLIRDKHVPYSEVRGEK